MSSKLIIFTIFLIAVTGLLASPTEKADSSSENDQKFSMPDIDLGVDVAEAFTFASFIKFLVFGVVVSGICLLLNNCGICDKIPMKG